MARPRSSLRLMTIVACFIMLIVVAHVGAEEIVDSPPVDANKMHDQENQEEESKPIGATPTPDTAPTSESASTNGFLHGDDDDIEFNILGH